MKLTITDPVKAETFSQLFQPMKTFTDSINITCKEDELSVQCMDSGMILIAQLNLPKIWFTTYEVEKPEVIGVSTGLLSKVLSIKDKTQGLEWNTHERTDHIFVRYSSPSDNKLVFEKTFEVPLIDLDSELMEIPPIEYSADFALPSLVFSSMIHQLKQFGEAVRIECTEEHIELVAESVEYGNMKTHIPIQDLEEYSIEEDGTVCGSYALKHLNLICQYQKIAKNMEVGVSSEYPMKMDFSMDENAQLTFYIAPRAEEN